MKRDVQRCASGSTGDLSACPMYQSAIDRVKVMRGKIPIRGRFTYARASEAARPPRRSVPSQSSEIDLCRGGRALQLSPLTDATRCPLLDVIAPRFVSGSCGSSAN